MNMENKDVLMYESPSVEVIEADVEKGFAVSTTSVEDGNWVNNG